MISRWIGAGLVGGLVVLGFWATFNAAAAPPAAAPAPAEARTVPMKRWDGRMLDAWFRRGAATLKGAGQASNNQDREGVLRDIDALLTDYPQAIGVAEGSIAGIEKAVARLEDQTGTQARPRSALELLAGYGYGPGGLPTGAGNTLIDRARDHALSEGGKDRIGQLLGAARARLDGKPGQSGGGRASTLERCAAQYEKVVVSSLAVVELRELLLHVRALVEAGVAVENINQGLGDWAVDFEATGALIDEALNEIENAGN